MSNFQKLSCCEKCCTNLFIFLLQISNFIDFLMGSFLLFCGIHVYAMIPSGANNMIATSLPFLLVSLGTILLFQVFLSCCAFTTPGCRCLVTPSAYFSAIISIFSFVLFLSTFIDKNSLFNYLNDHGAIELNLTASDIELIESNYISILYILLFVSLIQFLRFYLGLSIQNSLYRSIMTATIHISHCHNTTILLK